ncbi:neutral zinc metallopeptidase [Propionicicella superfundia]|uniref:neutral zinc metallopeptidase n=1 Tax=Propionicicella superfundia TaxID=348582 RepID=UPI000427753C|nr:neutral zinc metallopeptidase [Propionicicella superfundia]
MTDQQPPRTPDPRPAAASRRGRRRAILVAAAVGGVVILVAGIALALQPRPQTHPSQAPSTVTPVESPTPPIADESIPPAGPTTPVGTVFPTYNGNGAEDNVLYNISWPHDAATAGCPALGAYRPGGADAETKSAITAILDCLHRLNEPRLAEYEIQVASPPVVFSSDSVGTGCGSAITADSLGDYCGADGTLYFSLTALRSRQAVTGNPLALYWIAAHEYGHYLQHATNIAGTGATSTADSRRLELQATCMAGMFFNAAWTRMGATDDMLTQTHAMFTELYSGQTPGSGTHGTAASTQAWFDRGLAATTSGYAACNTFAAGPAEVR